MDRVEALSQRRAPPFRSAVAARAAACGVFGLCLFAANLYALPQHLFPALEPLRLGLLAAGLVVGGLGAHWVLGGPLPRLDLRTAALGAFLAIAALSPVWSLDPTASREAAAELAKMGLTWVAAACLLDWQDRLRRVCWSLGIAACIPAGFALSRYATGTNLLEGYRARWIGAFLDPNRLAMALVASSLLVLALRSRLRHPALRMLALAAAGLQIAAVVVTYSRGGALGLAVGLLVWTLAGARRGRGRSGAVVGMLAVGLLFLAPERFWNRAETIARYEEDASAMGRVHAWGTAGRILERRPLTGVGPAAFTAAWATYAPGEAGPHPYVAHNLFLEVAAELGLPALCAFLLLVGACCRGAFRASHRSSPVSEEGRGLLAALAGYLVCQLFAGFLLSFLLFLLLGMATAAERLRGRGADGGRDG